MNTLTFDIGGTFTKVIFFEGEREIAFYQIPTRQLAKTILKNLIISPAKLGNKAGSYGAYYLAKNIR